MVQAVAEAKARQDKADTEEKTCLEGVEPVQRSQRTAQKGRRARKSEQNGGHELRQELREHFVVRCLMGAEADPRQCWVQARVVRHAVPAVCKGRVRKMLGGSLIQRRS
jgi:chorismate mutase